MAFMTSMVGVIHKSQGGFPDQAHLWDCVSGELRQLLSRSGLMVRLWIPLQDLKRRGVAH
jgi:hypothetical protein